MQKPIDAMGWRFKALTDIWTGDANRGGERLIPTGLLGSIRWWFEVLVRGLGGKACDPTSPVRCPDSRVKDPTKSGHHCVVCELFGCTGWARKFRLMILDEDGQPIRSQIQVDQTFILRFTPLRKIHPEEWCLLDCTLRLIVDYGAIGGKTVFKPSDEPDRENAFHHRDFGLMEYVNQPEGWEYSKALDELRSYVTDASRWRQAIPYQYQEDRCLHGYSWASLENFWCVKGRYLAREDATKSTFNQVVGRKPDKSIKEQCGRRVIRWSDLLEEPNDEMSRWLAGRQQESKKVFSFKEPESARRTFGFVKPGLVSFEEMKNRLSRVWSGFQPDKEFQTGEQILKSYLP